MKLTKKLEAEILKAYHTTWDAYLNGDMRVFSSMLDDQCYIIGSAPGEVFTNKKSAVKYYKATSGQVTGKAEFRNRKITIMPVDRGFMVNEESHFYLLIDNEWTFYGDARISSLLNKKKNKWKVVHQHGSFPDSRAEEGEQVNADNIKAENIQLRDAVKRRTIELESKNRDLEIEAALEKVRSRSLAMHHSDELEQVVQAISERLTELGLSFDGTLIFNFEHQTRNVTLWIATNHLTAPLKVNLPYHEEIKNNKIIKDLWNAIENGEQIINRSYTGKIKDDYFRYVGKNNQSTIPEAVKQMQLELPNWSISLAAEKHAALGIDSWSGKITTDDEFKVLARFAKVFEQAYTRFLDLQKAEVQAREAEIQLALERVRARTMAMQHGSELSDTAKVLYEQFTSLGYQYDRFAIAIVNEAERVFDYWVTQHGGSFMDKTLKFTIDEPHVMQKMYQAWKTKTKSITLDLQGQALEEYFQFLKSTDAPVSQDRFVQRRVQNVATFSKGILTIISKESAPPEVIEILERFASVFDGTYTRFLDLQKAEEQAREAKIETALEKVRSRSLAMHKSDELQDVVHTVFEKLKDLNVELYTAIIFIFREGSKDIEWWLTNRDNQQYARILVPYGDNHYLKDIFAAREEGKDFFSATYSFEEKNELFHHLFDNTDFKHVTGKQKQFLLESELATMSIALAKNTGINITSYDRKSFSDSENEILKRFAKVFDQAYTRFLDLQKAEEQAKEAKIEAALERVRSKAMAMHRSEDLAAAVTTVFDEFGKLNLTPVRCGIGIIDRTKRTANAWTTARDEKGVMAQVSGDESMDSHPLLQGAFDAWTRQSDFSYTLEGEDISKYYNTQRNDNFKLPESQLILAPTQLQRQYYHLATFHAGGLFAFSDIEFTDEVRQLMKRFAHVFDLTYKRFLDLQMAEAQAREAKIEAALERVRSRAMAMQTSEELNALIGTVFIELTKLDLVLTRCVIMTYDLKTNDARWWMANSEAPEQPMNFLVKYHEHPPNLAYFKAWRERSTKWVYTLEGAEKKEWDDFIFTQTELSSLPDFVIAGMRAPGRVYLNASFNNSGNMTLASLEPLSNDHFDILIRFAKVFDLTYTRFNDLKQAEAQAREARIEAALEKVRSRSLAMHQSSELEEVIMVVSEQLKQLQFRFHNASFVRYNEEQGLSFWLASPASPHPYLIEAPYIDNPVMSRPLEALRKGEDFMADILTPEENRQYLRHVLGHSVLRNVSEEDKNFLLRTAGFARSVVLTKNIMLAIGNYAAVPYTDEQNLILKRFGNVFEQSYTRFLDLQKAEAQAREANIEASLERVRAKVMSMNSSSDLTETSFVFGEQLRKLGIDWQFSYFWLIEEDKDEHTFWITWPDNQTSTTSYSLAEADESFRECIVAWQRQDKLHSTHIPVEDVQAWLDTFERITQDAGGRAVEIMMPENFKDGVYYYDAMIRFGSFGILSNRPISESEKNIQVRFALEFERAYTRFLDLQKAEIQAREAQIEAGLERVRSRTMAMQKSDELAETAAIVFKQLIGLGIAPNRLYIGIIKGNTGEIEAWATDEDGGKVSTMFTLSSKRNISIKKMYDGWVEHKKSITIDMKGRELAEYIHYLEDELHAPVTVGHTQQRRVQNIAYFSKGFIGIASPDPQPEETIRLLERFAAVFNLTYTRFNDLQVAEAQAHKARIETALERVRARALAMQQPEELVEVAQVLRFEMGLLGVEELETCSIYIHDRGSDRGECWYALKQRDAEEKKMISDHFMLDMNATWVGQEMLRFSNSEDKRMSIVMTGANRKEWVDYCYEHSPAFTGFYGDTIPDRTYHLYKFSNGYIGAAAPGEISKESWELLQRTASVFSLAYSRFKDLTQARIDLVKLKEEKKRAEDALSELQVTQRQLIQSEKMASLGELTAGIAHEIQNPLNFVNNFSEVSNELIEEMSAEIEKGDLEEAKAIANDIRQNLEKINHHGKRADAIVKGMLQHSRTGSGQKEPTDINALADEYLRLAYHGLRAKDKSINAVIRKELDESIGKIRIIPQDIGRVLLNLINNAFYAVSEKQKQNPDGYEPTVSVMSKNLNGKVELRVMDNGTGIPGKVLDKIFQPFFTTKPTGEGTGLGLSLSYDIITKGHGGELKAETKEGDGSTFIIILPTNNE